MASAREFAARAHAGQRDKAGRDYFCGHLVPIAAAAELFGPQVQAAAWLHDVLEDTDATTGQLAQAGLPSVVMGAVEAVTRRPGETYSELIERAAGPSGAPPTCYGFVLWATRLERSSLRLSSLTVQMSVG